MNLPSYFLADLPPEAELNSALISEACQTLKRNRERYLDARTTDSAVRLLDSLAKEWLSPDFPFRRFVMEASPEVTGFTTPVLMTGLDQFFESLTAENLESMLWQELGHPQRLDNFFPNERGFGSQRSAMALGPQLIAHVAPGNLPIPIMMDMVLGLLARSAQFVKCASGRAFVPRMFAHSLYDADHKIGACIEVAEWKGGIDSLDSALFEESDCVTATGSDETLAAISGKVPRRTRFLGYGTRVSFGYITRESLRQTQSVVKRTASDVIAWNQCGCLSPHVIYVEEGGVVTGETFADLLATELEALEGTHPRGPLTATEASDIARRRSFYEIRAAHSPETRMWASKESTSWTVVLESDPKFQVSCLNRFIYVKSVTQADDAIHGADAVREKISTVGLAATAGDAPELARKFAGWGVKRVCPLGQMQRPPLGWRHDGRPALGDLVTWCDWEK
ncbi:MAG TPA: acyl-CoA reductase [Verrucomicrobiae bacterium]